MEHKIKVNSVVKFHDNSNYSIPGYVTVFSEHYFAWWEMAQPQRLYIRETTESRADVIALQIGGTVTTPAGALRPLEETFAIRTPDVNKYGDASKREQEFDEAEMSFSCQSETGSYLYHVKFRSASISLWLDYTDNSGQTFTLSECAVGETSQGASRFRSECIFDSNPMSHGIYHHDLYYPMSSGCGHGDWWFTPSPFCFPLQSKDTGKWIGLCAEPTVDQLMFRGFTVRPGRHLGELSFVYDYPSLPDFPGTYTSPATVFRFGAETEYDALRLHAEGVAAEGKVAVPQRADIPWWKGVMACGWSNQAVDAPRGGAYNCTQAVYQKHMDTYDACRVPVDMITIDDFWGTKGKEGLWEVDTSKWPDLRGFIEGQHAKGRHVILWVCIQTHGLPKDELYLSGGHELLDPCNPKYRSRIRETFRRMLSDEEGCYHADGIKLDFTGCTPIGKPDQAAQHLCGVGYWYKLFELYHDAAKSVRPDCLLDYQVANPYMAAFYDMTRLNDYYISDYQHNALRVMSTRAKIATASGLGALVDMDGVNTADYITNCGQYGNVSLYLCNSEIESEELLPILQRLKSEY